jgi:hypothetical protein
MNEWRRDCDPPPLRNQADRLSIDVIVILVLIFVVIIIRMLEPLGNEVREVVIAEGKHEELVRVLRRACRMIHVWNRRSVVIVIG